MIKPFYNYKVYFTPLANKDSNIYGSEIDVSDRIEMDGIGSISKSIDAGDYDVGVFVFNELTLKGFNYNGYFNDENDSRSIFNSTRDRCKVRVVFYKNEAIRNSQGTILSDTETTTITFQGIINEEGTRLDVVAESITFKVLSRDSVLRTTKVQGGAIDVGTLCSTAIFSILNQPKITSVLTVLEANINPPIDFAIDVATEFNDKSVKEALDWLMLATNSVLLVDSSGVVYVKDRSQNDITALNLYGKSDQQGRENIIDISSYNSGRQRMFTAVKVNDTEEENAVFVQAFGYRRKAVDLPWVTDLTKKQNIATALVDEFKFPKIELNVKVSTDLAKDVNLLDPVSINYPLRTKPRPGTFLPVVDVAKIDDALTPLPDLFGAIEIKPRMAFKVIGIDENPNEFTSVLKLRQWGKGYEDGFFDQPGSNLVDFAIIGESTLGPDSDPADTWNPSAVGAALTGFTRVA